MGVVRMLGMPVRGDKAGDNALPIIPAEVPTMPQTSAVSRLPV